MSKPITIKLSVEQLSLLATTLFTEIINLEDIDEDFAMILHPLVHDEKDHQYVSCLMSRMDSAQFAVNQKHAELKHLLKTIESTSKQKFAWNNDLHRMEAQS
jgi:hypothetical protein